MTMIYITIIMYAVISFVAIAFLLAAVETLLDWR